MAAPMEKKANSKAERAGSRSLAHGPQRRVRPMEGAESEQGGP